MSTVNSPTLDELTRSKLTIANYLCSVPIEIPNSAGCPAVDSPIISTNGFRDFSEFFNTKRSIKWTANPITICEETKYYIQKLLRDSLIKVVENYLVGTSGYNNEYDTILKFAEISDAAFTEYMSTTSKEGSPDFNQVTQINLAMKDYFNTIRTSCEAVKTTVPNTVSFLRQILDKFKQDAELAIVNIISKYTQVNTGNPSIEYLKNNPKATVISLTQFCLTDSKYKLTMIPNQNIPDIKALIENFIKENYPLTIENRTDKIREDKLFYMWNYQHFEDLQALSRVYKEASSSSAAKPPEIGMIIGISVGALFGIMLLYLFLKMFVL